MEYRQLGNSGLRVPVLSFGTATFGGSNEFFKAWGSTQVAEAKRLVNLCLDAGVNLFDTECILSWGVRRNFRKSHYGFERQGNDINEGNFSNDRWDTGFWILPDAFN